MTLDSQPRAALEPAASLTSVRVKRRKLAVAPSGKRGDLTASNEARPESEPAAARQSCEIIVLPPPPLAPALREAALPFTDVLLPELTADAEAADPADAIALLPELVLPEMPTPERAPEPEPEPEPEVPELLLLPPTPEPTQLAFDELPPEMAEPTDAEVPATEAESREDILDYWDGVRGARELPTLDDLDREHIAATWPNTLLVAVEAAELPRITRLGENSGEIEYTAMVLDWIMARGRHSAKRGEPMEEDKRFAVASGGARYRLLLLPLGSDDGKSDHVLCQLARVEELSAVASFRRWLTG